MSTSRPTRYHLHVHAIEVSVSISVLIVRPLLPPLLLRADDGNAPHGDEHPRVPPPREPLLLVPQHDPGEEGGEERVEGVDEDDATGPEDAEGLEPEEVPD